MGEVPGSPLGGEKPNCTLPPPALELASWTRFFARRVRGAESPAPIDCKLKNWTPWTPCTACTEETVRFQYVERHSQFGGSSCVHSQWDKKLCPDQNNCEPQDECRCISQHLLCNGDNDCELGSDEENCEETQNPETKCVGMISIPGAPKATQGYNALSNVFVNPVLDPKYFGGVCEYIYNGEWRELTYDSFCEHLHYSDDEKYFRKPYNFLTYRMMAHSLGQGSIEQYSDSASLLTARKTEDSFNFGFTIGIMYVEGGISASQSKILLKNISQYDSKDVHFARLVSTVETAQFKMRSRDLMLHEDMLQSLMELPEHYDFGAYSRFINEYGTHYITQGVMGGTLDYIVVLDREIMERARESDQGRDRLVKGGITGPGATQLVIRNAESYRSWGKSLKYNPAVIKFQGLPIYELVRFSTAASQARTRLPLLKQAWEEYMQQFNPCHCAPCRNNGIPVLSQTSCSCLCKERIHRLACEKSQRKHGPIHGTWSCWSSWSSCTSGTKTRRRECNNPAPKDNGIPCKGNAVQNKRC
ncbi:Complement component C8 alpha chain [Bagarius yarrelli]|uniref:Complement component C8 alpha chain n=1 Tax=Bagarius yarrelli TaxID=175774 RepID=A0A556VAX5_BAGYA|nr:Complement component C8 alpha chain [Bagarius yarrelli]